VRGRFLLSGSGRWDLNHLDVRRGWPSPYGLGGTPLRGGHDSKWTESSLLDGVN